MLLFLCFRGPSFKQLMPYGDELGPRIAIWRKLSYQETNELPSQMWLQMKLKNLKMTSVIKFSGYFNS